MSTKFFIFLIFLTFVACKKTPPDGDYCAKVYYQNAGSKKQSSYTVIVEVSKNQLIDISFPEAHYDHSDIKPITIPENGKVTAVSKSGQVYKVEMQGPAEKCIKATNMVQCKGKSKNGNRCKRNTDSKDGLCWQHKGQ
jgi:hypothetical protein